MPEQEKYALEVGCLVHILAWRGQTDARYRVGGVRMVAELPTKRRRSVKLTDPTRPGAYYCYYLPKDLVKVGHPDAIAMVIAAVRERR